MIAHDMAVLLDSAGLVNYDESGVGGDCFLEGLPDSPDDGVTLVSTGGSPPEFKLAYDVPSFQVIVRGGRNPKPVHDRCKAIIDTLHGLGDTELPTGTWLVKCAALQSEPITLGRDSLQRQRYSVNFDCEVENLTGPRPAL